MRLRRIRDVIGNGNLLSHSPQKVPYNIKVDNIIMLTKKIYLKQLSMLALWCCSASLAAKQYFVENQQAYHDIAANLVAGDTVVLKDGNWKDFEILLQGKGQQDAPITLTAETKGGVILTGQSNLRLAGQYLVASGLVFKNGYTPSSAVIAFRRNKDDLAYHSRVTEVVIDNYSNPDKRETDYWVALYGKHNRFDHSHLVGKRNRGVAVAVRLDSKESQENHHRIDHNYFGYRPTLGSNGGETLRIGTSHYSLTNSFTMVDHNVFEQTNGEVEIISVKSGKNTLRNNVFYEARGTLTLRHGNGNIIEENIFFGNGVDHTGGIRVINKDQIVRNNYLEGLTGYRFGSGLTVMNGVPDSPVNRYHQVDNAVIANNTFVNVSHIQLAAGSDAERSAVPVNSVMKNNLIINQTSSQPFTLFDDVSGITFADNVANTKPPKQLAYGITTQEVAVKRDKNGLLYPLDDNISAGAKPGLPVISKSETGVSWYSKQPAVVAFDSGQTHSVSASPDALYEAIAQAKTGDVLALAPGSYDVRKLLTVAKTLTIKAQSPGTAKLTFQRSALFEIHDGGSLKLDGVHISGSSSPDASGNSVVRTKKWGMVENYRFAMLNSTITQLNVNHTFNFFTSGKGAFADEISLVNNRFSDVTGDILSLNKETEDLGIYNAEYVTLHNNTFTDIHGAIMQLYRGGTDESTFGPHLVMKNNTVRNAGHGKRNKSEASVYLHGVQVASLNSNTFAHSAPVVIEHTVGEPITSVVNNTFDTTNAPVVTELHAPEPHTAALDNNRVINQRQR